MKLFLLLFCGIIIFSSCDKNSTECDESKVCYTLEPDSLYIELQLSPSPDGSPVEVRFYEGNVDDGELYYSFLTNNQLEYFLMPVKRKYAAEAIYQDGEKKIIAVDGDKLETDYTMNCDVKCYEWEEDLIFDLKLK